MSDRNFLSLWFYVAGIGAVVLTDHFIGFGFQSLWSVTAVIVGWLLAKGIYKFFFGRSFT